MVHSAASGASGASGSDDFYVDNAHAVGDLENVIARGQEEKRDLSSEEVTLVQHVVGNMQYLVRRIPEIGYALKGR